MTKRVIVSVSGGIADVRLNRAEKMNALDFSTFEALIDAANSIARDPSVRVAILSGEGRGFCAGVDTTIFEQMAAGSFDRHQVTRGASENELEVPAIGQKACLIWRDVPVPVIAAVHGVAFGGGLQLALGADFRFITPDCSLAFMELKWGLVPDMGGFVTLPSLVQNDFAREILLTGRTFSGSDAKEWGLAARLCADPRSEAIEVARAITQLSPDAVRASKRLLNTALVASARDVLRAEALEGLTLIGSKNQIEAVGANIAKRKPVFSDGR